MEYIGIGLKGNESALYARGNWAPGGSVYFMLKEGVDSWFGPGGNGDGKLHFNFTSYPPPNYLYLPNLDISLIPRWPAPTMFNPPFFADMADVFLWDLEVWETGPLGNIALRTVYFQGLIVDSWMPLTVDAGNGVKGN
jgi:hypothetical protein